MHTTTISKTIDHKFKVGDKIAYIWRNGPRVQTRWLIEEVFVDDEGVPSYRVSEAGAGWNAASFSVDYIDGHDYILAPDFNVGDTISWKDAPNKPRWTITGLDLDHGIPVYELEWHEDPKCQSTLTDDYVRDEYVLYVPPVVPKTRTYKITITETYEEGVKGGARDLVVPNAVGALARKLYDNPTVTKVDWIVDYYNNFGDPNPGPLGRSFPQGN